MNNPLILDGGMGRELQRIGAPFRQPEWSALALIEAPDFVRAGPCRLYRGRRRRHHDQQLCGGALPYRRGALLSQGRPALADRAGSMARRPPQLRMRVGSRSPGSIPPLFGSYRPDLFDAGRAPGLLEMLDRWPGPACRPSGWPKPRARSRRPGRSARLLAATGARSGSRSRSKTRRGCGAAAPALRRAG